MTDKYLYVRDTHVVVVVIVAHQRLDSMLCKIIPTDDMMPKSANIFPKN